MANYADTPRWAYHYIVYTMHAAATCDFVRNAMKPYRIHPQAQFSLVDWRAGTQDMSIDKEYVLRSLSELWDRCHVTEDFDDMLALDLEGTMDKLMRVCMET